MINRVLVVTASQLAMIGVLFSCQGVKTDAAKELGLLSGRILRIAVSEEKGKPVDIVDTVGISFFLSQLRRLDSRTEKGARTQFYLTIYQTGTKGAYGSGVVSLRMGRSCIGPLASDSEEAVRWYFENDSLYDFFERRLQGSR